MDVEKQAEPGARAGDNTHIVQVVDDMGRTVGRDAFKSKAEAEVLIPREVAPSFRDDVAPLFRD